MEPVSEDYDDLSDLKPHEMDQVKEWELQFSEKYTLVGEWSTRNMISMGQPKFLISMSHIHTYRQTNILTYPRILISSHNGRPMLIILRVLDLDEKRLQSVSPFR